ncbi:uncharacterized protein BYT42DRAFT_618523 [Radiomyces spectabilis]|uniref:uncharacterized protein n=1 Tax=Radiomyces spectabilis TaxID=64574 RepID=UPI00221F9116|nr:uncharacterized protein BYT42DRAFT_618523 [Radiomyces spectabilis]KAI8366090.1 hypothetical protein BYT42DRAFT_618523 [Radiomyces spectabilis]
MSSNASEQEVLAAASNFEANLFQQSPNQEQYMLAYTRKLNQIKYRIQLQTQGVTMSNGNTTTTGTGLANSMSVDNGALMQPPPTGPMFSQIGQTYIMGETGLNPVPSTLAQENTAQQSNSVPVPPIASTQPASYSIPGCIATTNTSTTLQQPPATHPGQPYNSFQMLANTNPMNVNPALSSTAFKVSSVPHQSQTATVPHVQDQLKYQTESGMLSQVSQHPPLATSSHYSMARMSPSGYHFVANQSASAAMNQELASANASNPTSPFIGNPQQMQMYNYRLKVQQMQQLIRQNGQIAAYQPPSSHLPYSQHVVAYRGPPSEATGPEPERSIEIMAPQQQQQQQQQLMSSQAGNYALQLLYELKNNIQKTRGTLSEEEKAVIHERMMLMKPLYKTVEASLPLFMMISWNMEATRKMILLMYLYEDQLLLLSQNQFIMTFNTVVRLQNQFNGFCNWINHSRAMALQQHQQRLQASQQQPFMAINSTQNRTSYTMAMPMAASTMAPSQEYVTSQLQLSSSSGMQQMNLSSSPDPPSASHVTAHNNHSSGLYQMPLMPEVQPQNTTAEAGPQSNSVEKLDTTMIQQGQKTPTAMERNLSETSPNIPVPKRKNTKKSRSQANRPGPAETSLSYTEEKETTPLPVTRNHTQPLKGAPTDPSSGVQAFGKEYTDNQTDYDSPIPMARSPQGIKRRNTDTKQSKKTKKPTKKKQTAQSKRVQRMKDTTDKEINESLVSPRSPYSVLGSNSPLQSATKRPSLTKTAKPEDKDAYQSMWDLSTPTMTPNNGLATYNSESHEVISHASSNADSLLSATPSMSTALSSSISPTLLSMEHVASASTTTGQSPVFEISQIASQLSLMNGPQQQRHVQDNTSTMLFNGAPSSWQIAQGQGNTGATMDPDNYPVDLYNAISENSMASALKEGFKDETFYAGESLLLKLPTNTDAFDANTIHSWHNLDIGDDLFGVNEGMEMLN